MMRGDHGELSRVLGDLHTASEVGRSRLARTCRIGSRRLGCSTRERDIPYLTCSLFVRNNLDPVTNGLRKVPYSVHNSEAKSNITLNQK